MHSARYLSAAIFGSDVASWNRNLFLVEYVGPTLAIWAYIALIAGVLHFIWGELTES